MNRIVIDGRKAQGSRTGVGHYIHSLLLNWPATVPTLVLYNSREESPDLGIPSKRIAGKLRWHFSAWMESRKQEALYFSPESLLVPILLGRRACLTVHDLTPLDLPSMHNVWNVIVHRVALRLAVARSGAVIVPTEAVKHDLLRHFPRSASKAQVVYEGVRDGELLDHAAVESKSWGWQSQPYALYVGTVEPRKNVPALIRAFIDVVPEPWSLVVAGKVGWLDDQQKLEFEQLIANDRVVYLGFVPDNWLASIFSSASLFCYVSESEGFGLPVAEAMAWGVPVIHSDDPALLEVAGGTGIVVRRSDLAVDLRAALVAFAELAPEERQVRINLARERAAIFSWPAAAVTTRQILLGLNRAHA